MVGLVLRDAGREIAKRQVDAPALAIEAAQPNLPRARNASADVREC